MYEPGKVADIPTITAIPPKTTAQIFREAAEIIKARGWCQGRFEEADGSVCTYAAVSIAATGSVWGLNLWEPAYKALTAEIGADICDWNNATIRTKEDVIAAYERCAEKTGETNV